MKTLLHTAIATALMLAQPAAVLAIAGGPTLSAQQFESNVTAGNTFTVTVSMDTKTYSVTAAELHLTFPADKLQALSISAGSFLPMVLTAGATGSGTASITVGSGTEPKQGTGTVATVQFRALAAGSAQVAFASSTQVAASGQAGNVVDMMTPTTVTILAGSGTPTPTATPLPTFVPTPTPSTIIGGAGTVSTGPMETGLMALIVSSIAVLAYAGYTGTEEFRRREARSIAASSKNSSPDLNR